MGKRKLGSTAVPMDENDDGWLSTRNKKKLSPPLLKTPGGRRCLHRPVARSPLMLLMEEAPAQPSLSARKQTTIADFFTPHLKDLPSTGGVSGEGVQLQETGSVSRDSSAQAADFCMPSLALSHTSPTHTASPVKRGFTRVKDEQLARKSCSERQQASVASISDSDVREERDRLHKKQCPQSEAAGREERDRLHKQCPQSEAAGREERDRLHKQCPQSEAAGRKERDRLHKKQCPQSEAAGREERDRLHKQCPQSEAAGDDVMEERDRARRRCSSEQEQSVASSLAGCEVESVDSRQWPRWEPAQDGGLTDSLQTPDFLKTLDTSVDMHCSAEELHSQALLGFGPASGTGGRNREGGGLTDQGQACIFTDLRSIQFTDSLQSNSLSQTQDPHFAGVTDSDQSAGSSKQQCGKTLRRLSPEARADSPPFHQTSRDWPAETRCLTPEERPYDDSMLTPAFSLCSAGSLALEGCSEDEDVVPVAQSTACSQAAGGNCAVDDLHTPGFLHEMLEDSQCSLDHLQ